VASVEAKGLAKVYGGRKTSYPSDSWPAQHALLLSIVWRAGLVVVFAPLAVLRYRAIGR
jgi:hypothetical protein